MANYDMADAEAILKRYYKPNVIGDVVTRKNAFYKIIPKNTNLSGELKQVPIKFGNVQNSSGTGAASFSTTYATASVKTTAFYVPPVRALNRATIDRLAMKASRNNEGAFLETATLQIDGAIEGRAGVTETELFREGWGDLGVIAAGGVSGSSFTLESTGDTVNFEEGMKLVFADSQSSDALRSPNPLIVVGVNEDTGVITCNSALSGPGAVAGDWVFLWGCREDSATPTRLVPAGLGAYIPVVAPSSSPAGDLYGCVRSTFPTRLAGNRLDATGASYVEAVNKAAALVSKAGGSLDTLLLSSTNMGEFITALGTKYQYQGLELTADKSVKVGASAIKVLFDGGSINVVACPKCPDDKMYGLTLKTWSLESMGADISLFEDDAEMIRLNQEDAYEVRVGGYHMVTNNAPGHNVVIYNIGA